MDEFSGATDPAESPVSLVMPLIGTTSRASSAAVRPADRPNRPGSMPFPGVCPPVRDAGRCPPACCRRRTTNRGQGQCHGRGRWHRRARCKWRTCHPKYRAAATRRTRWGCAPPATARAGGRSRAGDEGGGHPRHGRFTEAVPDRIEAPLGPVAEVRTDVYLSAVVDLDDTRHSGAGTRPGRAGHRAVSAVD